jgi:hypothetical protein
LKPHFSSPALRSVDQYSFWIFNKIILRGKIIREFNLFKSIPRTRTEWNI